MNKSLVLLAAVLLGVGVRGAWADPAATQAAGDAASTQPITLQVGDAAPVFSPGKWLKGNPVARLEAGKSYVVEFWATWCGPCRASIPHLTKLQKEHPEITFIGIDGQEPDPAAPPQFVQKMGDKMDYLVAQDDADGTMGKTWMDAAGQDVIPCAFLIDKDSRIEWIGHPMELGDILKQIASGTFDPKKEAAAEAVRDGLMKKIEAADQAGNLDQALDLLDQFTKASPDHAKDADIVRFGILLEKKDYPAALKLAKGLVETFKDESDALNAIAWSLVDPQNPVPNTDLEVAAKAADRANELTGGDDAEVLDTVAHVYYLKGDLDRAIKAETAAMAKVDDPDEKQVMQKTLADYQAKKNTGN